MSLSEYKVKLHIFIVILISTSVSATYAQDLEPKAYTNIPYGINFLVGGYGYSSGGVLFDPAVPLDNANIKTHAAVLAYARSLNIGGLAGKVDMILPYAWLSGTADFDGEPVSRTVSGLGDPRVRLSVIFLGAPALPLSGFKEYKQNFVMGAGIQVYLPLGQYDQERLVNIGTNRFAFRPELGMSKTFGNLILELAGGATFYTTNHDFYYGNKRSQAPIGSIQGHVIYNFKKGIWAALDGTYYWGGRTTTNGIKGNDLQNNTRMGFTFALPLNMHNSLKFYLSSGVSTRTGSDFDALGIVWQYRWGGGLPK
ncbi:transporter [Draconibacterium sp.]|nr:transporter [Draconibacterium sp.]